MERPSKVAKVQDWDVKDFVMKAVQESGANLRFANELLQADRDVVLAAVSQARV